LSLLLFSLLWHQSEAVPARFPACCDHNHDDHLSHLPTCDDCPFERRLYPLILQSHVLTSFFLVYVLTLQSACAHAISFFFSCFTRSILLFICVQAVYNDGLGERGTLFLLSGDLVLWTKWIRWGSCLMYIQIQKIVEHFEKIFLL